MEIKIDHKHYDKYVEIYNDQGSQVAKDYVNNICGMDINQFQRKMRRETDYIFNKSIKRYDKGTIEDEPFISLEELCSTRSPRMGKETQSMGQAFNDLIFELMRDRLFEMQKFIRIDQGARQIVVDKKLAKDHGYILTIN